MKSLAEPQSIECLECGDTQRSWRMHSAKQLAATDGVIVETLKESQVACSRAPRSFRDTSLEVLQWCRELLETMPDVEVI